MSDPAVQYPHCDSRILHAPGQCGYCDRHPDWQSDRMRTGVAFTGQTPRPGQQPCPADAARPPGSSADHRHWYGNVAQPEAVVNEPEDLAEPDYSDESPGAFMVFACIVMGAVLAVIVGLAAL